MKTTRRFAAAAAVLAAVVLLPSCAVDIQVRESYPPLVSPGVTSAASPSAEPEPTVSAEPVETPVQTPAQTPVVERFVPTAAQTARNGDRLTVTLGERVGDGLPGFIFTVEGREDSEGYYPFHAQRLTVTNAETGEAVSAFDVDTTCDRTDLGIRIADVNFDGMKDIMLFNDIGGAHENITYLAYLWDAKTAAFVKEESFSNIVNATVDEQRRAILEIYSDSASSLWYSVWRYEGGRFIQEAGLMVEYVPEGEEYNGSVQKRPLYVYTELQYQNGQPQTVTNFSYEDAAGELPEEAREYYAPGSYWDLDNPVWVSGDHYDYESDG